MATTDVSGLVTPVYTTTLPVTTDGSVFTQADLTTLVVSLGNRIEFVRDLVPDATDTPEVFARINEDFLDAVVESQTIYGTIPWTVIGSGTGIGGLAVSHVAGSAKNPGGLQISTPATLGDISYSFFIGPGATSTPFSFASFSEFTVVAKISQDTTTLLTPFVRFGLAANASFANGGNESLGLAYGPAFGPNWLLLRRKGGAQFTTALVPMVLGEHVTVRFKKDAISGDVGVYVDGVLITTVAAADVPTGGCTFGGHQSLAGAEGATFVTSVYDFIGARFVAGNRSGV